MRLWYLLLSAILATNAQQQQSLSLDTLYAFAGPNIPTFVLPQEQQLVVSVALCSNEPTSPIFLVTNNSHNAAVVNSSDVFQLPLQRGFGQWAGTAPQGGFLAVQNIGQTSFQVVVSNGCMYLDEYSPFILMLPTNSSCTSTIALAPPGR